MGKLSLIKEFWMSLRNRKKMVACANYNHPFIIRDFIVFCAIICGSAFYIYVVLRQPIRRSNGGLNLRYGSAQSVELNKQ